MERSLAWWINAQRRAATLNSLDGERVQALNQAAPHWQTGAYTLAWEETRADVAAFYASNGYFPRQSAEHKSEVRLARWVDAQRQAHRLGKLSGPRTQALENMPAWKWTVTKRYGWDSNLQSYADFIRVNGNRPTLDGERSDEWRLYKWLARQREAAARGDLTSQRAADLESVDPGWDSTRRTRPSQAADDTPVTYVTTPGAEVTQLSA